MLVAALALLLSWTPPDGVEAQRLCYSRSPADARLCTGYDGGWTTASGGAALLGLPDPAPGDVWYVNIIAVRGDCWSAWAPIADLEVRQ